MSLYDDAVAAYQTAQGDREAEARNVLTAVLTPFDQSVLTVADLEVRQDRTRYVFADPGSDIFLAVALREDGDYVQLVTGSLGDWSGRGVVRSLAELGKMLPGVVAPPATSGPAAWEPGVAYSVGDEVTYSGSTYRCRQAHTSQADWTPSAVPALWVVA